MLPFTSTTIDPAKPMRMYFTHSDYEIDQCHYTSTYIWVHPKLPNEGTANAWYRFNYGGINTEYPAHRLLNVELPKRMFTKKAALVEWWSGTYLHTITPQMEAFEGGFLEYFRKLVPGKVIAVKVFSCTEGEGLTIKE